MSKVIHFPFGGDTGAQIARAKAVFGAAYDLCTEGGISREITDGALLLTLRRELLASMTADEAADLLERTAKAIRETPSEAMA